eukprot:scaffold1201_cov413-Prasinococcus_capsulatus_cf.AAC.13
MMGNSPSSPRDVKRALRLAQPGEAACDTGTEAGAGRPWKVDGAGSKKLSALGKRSTTHCDNGSLSNVAHKRAVCRSLFKRLETGPPCGLSNDLWTVPSLRSIVQQDSALRYKLLLARQRQGPSRASLFIREREKRYALLDRERRAL